MKRFSALAGVLMSIFIAPTVHAGVTVYVKGKGGYVVKPDGTTQTCPEPSQNHCATIQTRSFQEFSVGSLATLTDVATGETITIEIESIDNPPQNNTIDGSSVSFSETDE